MTTPVPTTASRIWTTIDFSADGKQSDYLRIPYSTDDSAYGWQPVPIVVIKRGEGKTVLLTAGTHGDEWEGQIALRQLAASLQPEHVTGRVMILPSLNYSAAREGRRVSPLDQGNLNRLFPGQANGTPTDMIAHYVSSKLIPLSDAAVDLHAGGRSLSYLPVAYAHPGKTEALKAITRALLSSFDAPHSVLTDGSAGGGATTLYAAASAFGIPALTAELGGGGTLSEDGLAIATRGIRRVLSSLGIAEFPEGSEPGVTGFYRSIESAGSVYAPHSGIFRPAADIGDDVRVGDLAGEMFSFINPVAEPVRLSFPRSGKILARRFPSQCEHGDCLFTLCAPVMT